MPATQFSVLESKPVTNLRPGETGIRLVDDPYYGKVDIGTEPTPPDPNAPVPLDPSDAKTEMDLKLEALGKAVEDGSHSLNGEEQGHVEVLTGKRLQPKVSDEAPREPEMVEAEPTPGTGSASSGEPLQSNP